MLQIFIAYHIILAGRFKEIPVFERVLKDVDGLTCVCEAGITLRMEEYFVVRERCTEQGQHILYSC